jgi:hypothetical protein
VSDRYRTVTYSIPEGRNNRRAPPVSQAKAIPENETMFLETPGPVILPVLLGMASLTVGVVGLVWNALSHRGPQ